MKKAVRLSYIAMIGIVLMCTGCGMKYQTPGAGANISGLFEYSMDNVEKGLSPADAEPVGRNDETIQKIVNRQPASPLPVNLVLLRLQDEDYWSYSCHQDYIRRGAYTIITTRDIEEDEDFERIQKFPQMAQVGSINRLLLPPMIHSEKDLRLSAAKLRADMLFLYTVDTKYWSEDMAKPLSVLTLGFSPSVNLHMVSTVSGVLFDVRTGFVYGTVEATEKKKQLTSWWANSDTADQARLRVEKQAFKGMLNDFEKLWVGIVAERAAVLNMQAAAK